MTELVRHPFFQKAVDVNPQLGCLSGTPILMFDRAIYAVDLDDSAQPSTIESAFPPAQFDFDLENQEFSGESIFINSSGVTCAVLERDGKREVFSVLATHPFSSKFDEQDKKAIQKFIQESALCLAHFLEAEVLIIHRLAEYFSSGLDSSVHLLKQREALAIGSSAGIES
jgi:hypothetical protein